MTELRIGSAEHKALFCGEFNSTHHVYEPREIVWPDLDDASLQRLRALPFWQEAVSSERTAAARVQKMAEVERDPMLRDAIALQGYEEGRHAALLETLLAHYRIEIPPDGPEVPRDAEWGFLRMGYGELFDSFFAFGLFRIAADTGVFPAPLVHLFDGVMQEEARHILFFQNWAVYRRKQLPAGQRPWFLVRRGLGLAVQAMGRIRTALQLRGAGESDDFTMQVPEELSDGDITLAKLARTCLGENERRLAEYDPRLLRPHTVPRLVQTALRLMPPDGKPPA
jgi:hypothetical protein